MSQLSNKFTTYFFLLFLFFTNTTLAQTKEVKLLITSWSKSNTSQTQAAELTYQQLKLNKDESKYTRSIADLRYYLDANPNPRLQARLIMYIILGKYNFKQEVTQADYLRIKKAIKIARELNDEQLTAEIYALTAAMNFYDENLLFNLKSVELQQKIGFSHFPFVYKCFYSISLSLYGTRDYNQSIVYGLKALSFKETAADPAVHITQLDIIGASYRRIKQYDSAKYYYQKILQVLESNNLKEDDFKKLWVGIAKGNIGYAFAKQKNYKDAIPLLNEQLKCGIKYESWNNAAMAQNILSEIDFDHNRYKEALSGWRKAYQWSLKSQTLNGAKAAVKGMADVHKLIGNIDSAFFYYNAYHEIKDTLNSQVNRRHLSTASAKIAFDTTLNKLEKTKTLLSRERMTRNFILITIGLVIIITALAYNRQRLKHKLESEIAERKRKAFELEVEIAREKVSVFAEHIIEKDRLIGILNEALVCKSKFENATDHFTENLLIDTLITDRKWDKFRNEFTTTYPTFLPLLKRKLPGINPAEERLAVLTYLQLNNQQIASALGISKDSVSRSKRRLKLRFNLPQCTTLEDYLTNYYTEYLGAESSLIIQQ